MDRGTLIEPHNAPNPNDYDAHYDATSNSDHHHHQHQSATTTTTTTTALNPLPPIGPNADSGCCGVSDVAAAAAAAADGNSGVAHDAGSIARRRVSAIDLNSPVARSPPIGSGSGSGSSKRQPTAASCGGIANRKQAKNDSNRGLRKQHHASGGMPGSAPHRTERKSAFRLSKDSCSERGSRDEAASGIVVVGAYEETPPSSMTYGVSGGAGSSCSAGDCDQDNKRPTMAIGTRGVSSSSSSSVRGGSNLSFVRKSGPGGGVGGGTPNKWDAVMSKIAENKKSVPRRSFSEVKSRISCGNTSGRVSLVRRDSPATPSAVATGTPKSPPSEAASITSRISSVSSKRTVSAKRGRTQSKDSQQSSLSDLSLSGGSPKLTPKVSSTRPAKKRDVRTINSSSSDLGPPPSKTNGTQQPPRSSAARAAAALQKRISSNSSSAATNTLLVPEQLKGSPPTKRNLLLKRNGASKGDSNRLERAHEHNRLVGASPATKSASAAVITPSNHSPKPATKSLIRSSTTSSSIGGSGGGGGGAGTGGGSSTTATTTANQQTTAGQHNHAAGSNGVTSVKAIQRNGTIILDKTNSPLLLSEGPKPAATVPKATTVEVTGSVRNGTVPAAAVAAVGAGGESICDRRDRTMVAIRSDREHHPGVAGKQSSAAAVAASVAITSSNAALQQQQPQQQQQQLVDVSLLNHAQKGVEALGVLVQYLVFNLDAFSCPTIKTAHQKTTHDLLEARSMLDDARTSSQTLKQQLLETTERETELQELHRCELSRVETCLTEQQRNAEDRIASLQSQQHEQESYNRELLARIDDYETKVVAQAKQLENARTRELDLLQRINALSCTENELREKVHSSELAFSERLQAAAMRERDLTEQIKGLNRDLDRMRRETEQKERELEEKLTITKDECVVLRQSRQSLVALDTVNPSTAQNGTSISACLSTSASPLQLNRSSGSINHLQVLQDEVDSLRCVLDLKQREISDLRKQTQQYERDAKELPAALVKISALESRIEDLQVQLKTKTEEEKDLQQKLKLLQDNLSQESKIKSRLSLHNEELQWRLKQNSEKFTLAYAELSKSYHENSSFMMVNASKSSLDHTVGASGGSHLQPQSQQQLLQPQQQQHSLHHTSRSSCSDRFFDMDDISPPTSPVIKGMVEKSDSVSWVLEIDDEPPEVSASRMVRRAGSFRSGAAYTESVAKRPKCGLNQSNGGGGIQQSTSAASILKQHSGDMSPTKPQAGGIPPVHQRLRSKSVSIKGVEPPKKIVRSNSGNSATVSSVIGCPTKPMRLSEMGLGPWKDQPLYSSSPYAHKRYLTEDNSELAGTSKTFGGDQPQRTKDLFLEETEVLSEPDSPFARRPPHLNGDDALTLPAEVFHRDKTPKFKKSKENRGLITCDTTVLTGSPKTTNGGTGVAAGLLPNARDKRREFTRKSNATNGTGGGPLEAAGEALVSGANSDDEATSSTSSSASSSSSCSLSEGSLSSGSSAARNALNGTMAGSSKRRNSDQMNGTDDALNGGANPAKEHRRRLSNISLEDALMKKIVASLNGGNEGNDTPMEVSWSEDGEDPASESIV
ncbi:microtubule-associated tumor suppressor 1 homolog isoform X2 [Anopheles darlingi]|uniref:microtubule-associated tumor suppressor 1 homolog isoform X2 n=1 Tax=Anopheles darlingi TaxID=43151 RepID=UPI0021003187|nr:microtubule-associated tumor suppressor 1 homolog isoform X2 [Anopheles darlingi]